MPPDAPQDTSTGRKPTQLAAYEKSDVGLVRECNEDRCFVDPQKRFFLVADGMGGHAAGDVASQISIDEASRCLDSKRSTLQALDQDPEALPPTALRSLLRRAAALAHETVRERAAEQPAMKGMGCTLDVLVVAGGRAWIAHVGDSRSYLVRGGKVSQLTTDHTVAQVLSEQQKVPPGELPEAWGSMLVNAIGAGETVNVEVADLDLRRGDKLLLCSDGLHQYFPREAELGELLDEEGAQSGLDRLIDMAKERGGQDNITGLLVEVLAVPAVRPSSRSADACRDTIPVPVVGALDDTLPGD